MRTVSLQTLTTSFRLTSSPASSDGVRHARPAGGGEQQMAASVASACPSMTGSTGGVARGLRSTAKAGPPRRNAARMRATVLAATPNARAICSSV